jgi:hypothetical protein
MSAYIVPPEIQTKAIRSLSRGVSREDVILSICERTRLDWPAAEAYINDLEAEHGFEIEKRSTPILTALGGLIALAGLALLSLAMAGIFIGLQIIFGASRSNNLLDSASFLAAGGMELIRSVALLPLALGMLIGGGMGIYRRIVPE